MMHQNGARISGAEARTEIIGETGGAGKVNFAGGWSLIAASEDSRP